MLTLHLAGKEYKLSEAAQTQIVKTLAEGGLAQFKKFVPPMAQSLVETMIIEEHKKLELRMVYEGVPIEQIKAARPKRGESYIDMIAVKFRPLLEGFLSNATVRLECNDNGEITHLFVEQQSKSPTGR